MEGTFVINKDKLIRINDFNVEDLKSQKHDV